MKFYYTRLNKVFSPKLPANAMNLKSFKDVKLRHISSSSQCLSQAVVCVSTPRMNPHSGSFLVFFLELLRALLNSAKN